tara:strand:- start:696 stop:2822 length:2127 start_codon:yes stop_codon:yes gene_type:complete
MSISNSTIIQLRQAEAVNIPQLADGTLQNGVFKSILDRPLMVENGDQITIKSVYLDTAEAGAGLIHVQEDIDSTFTIAMYIQNANKDQNYDWQQAGSPAEPMLRVYTQSATSTITNSDPGAFRGDNNLWWLAEASLATGINWKVTGVNIEPFIKGIDPLGYYGATTINWEYTPITPGAAPYSATAQTPMHPRRRKADWIDNNAKGLWHLNVQCKGTEAAPELRLAKNQPDGITKASQVKSVDFTPYQKKIESGETYYTLQNFDVNFKVPQGDYTPLELTQLLNDNFSNAEATGMASDEYGSHAAYDATDKNPRYPVMSPFLTTVLKNHDMLQRKATAAGIATIEQAFVGASGAIQTNDAGVTFDNNGKWKFNYNITAMRAEYNENAPIRPPLDCYIGTNQIDFQLDPQLNKIKIATAHFPIYGNSSSTPASGSGGSAIPAKIVYDAVPCVEYNDGNSSDINVADPNPVFLSSTGLPLRYSGIGIVAMNPPDFWYTTLGFGDVIIKPQYNAKLVPDGAAPTEPTDFNSFSIDAVDGGNVTGAYPGLDVGVQHHEDFYTQPIYNNFKGDGGDTVISTSDTTSIYADRVYNTAIADEGYFKVKIGNNIKQNLVGGRLVTSTDTQSVVNRYYTANSFTSDQGAGSVVYTHQGAPMFLSNFNVEITNPDDTFVDTHILKEKNTIFLELVKAVPDAIEQNTQDNLEENMGINPK